MPCSPIKGALFWHCWTGVQVALLACRGFQAPSEALDNREWGYWAGMSDRCDWDVFTHKLGEEYYLEKYLSFKPWSSCRWHHAGLEMMLKFLEEEKVDLVDIEEIVYKQHAGLVSYPPFHTSQPADAFEAMYSVPWAFASVALGYQPGPDWFADERRNDPRVKKLAKRVKLEEDAEVTRRHEEDPEKSFVKLVIKAKGKVYHKQTEYAKGDLQKPMTQDELEAKFIDMARRVVSDKQVERIIDTVNNLEELGNLRELTRDFSKSA